MVLQMLATGGFETDIPDRSGLRVLYFAMIIVNCVVFAILVGFITDTITAYMDSLKAGSTKVFEEKHTLILGWNESTPRYT